jgi:hypothetical protein
VSDTIHTTNSVMTTAAMKTTSVNQLMLDVTYSHAVTTT